MEQDLLAVDPTATATDAAGREDALTVSGLDERVGCGLPVGAFAGGEVRLPPVGTGEAEERQVLVVVGRQSHDLLAGVGQVEVDALVVTEDAERPRHFGSRVGFARQGGVFHGLEHFGRHRHVRRFGGGILRILADIRLSPDMSAHLVSGPAFGLSVGEVPAFGYACGRGDDADVRQLLADELDALAPGLVGIRPEEDAAVGEGRPVGEADGLGATRPRGAGEVRKQTRGGVGGLLALDDEHPRGGVGLG